jgi:DNA (cytosine-5)-methyltransferase 1
MTPPAIQQKLARLKAGARPRVLDLFSGCGGLSLGFQTAGFEMCAAVEYDPDAARSHGLNFHGGDAAHSRAFDITVTHPEDLSTALELGPVPMAVDVLVGGPPCQAFARVGRSKLREVEAHPEAFRHDPRARLYLEYLRYVDEFQPLVVLMENVPDVLNHGGQNIAEETCEVLSGKGYVCGYTLLNASYYGVPQMRERMFLIAYRRELEHAVGFPAPTHWVSLPPGYEGTRAVALKLLGGDLLAARSRYVAPPEVSRDLQPAVTAEEAIGDLPLLDARAMVEAGTLRRGARRFEESDGIPYPPGRRNLSAYARIMRDWPGFKAPAAIRDHAIRYLPRDYTLFERMNPGDQYPEAYHHALDMLDEKLAVLQLGGEPVKAGSVAYEALKKSIVPPYDASKFPNKWRKMWHDQPARTLMAHLGKDSYSHIHYDSAQARTISVREAARLQSFPDGFVFSGTMNPAFRQIGNAVPPLMAKALATTIARALGSRSTRQESQDPSVLTLKAV